MAASDLGLVTYERGLPRFQNRARGVGDDGAAGLMMVVALADVGQDARLVDAVSSLEARLRARGIA